MRTLRDFILREHIDRLPDGRYRLYAHGTYRTRAEAEARERQVQYYKVMHEAHTADQARERMDYHYERMHAVDRRKKRPPSRRHSDAYRAAYRIAYPGFKDGASREYRVHEDGLHEIDREKVIAHYEKRHREHQDKYSSGTRTFDAVRKRLEAKRHGSSLHGTGHGIDPLSVRGKLIRARKGQLGETKEQVMKTLRELLAEAEKSDDEKDAHLQSEHKKELARRGIKRVGTEGDFASHMISYGDKGRHLHSYLHKGSVHHMMVNDDMEEIKEASEARVSDAGKNRGPK